MYIIPIDRPLLHPKALRGIIRTAPCSGRSAVWQRTALGAGGRTFKSSRPDHRFFLDTPPVSCYRGGTILGLGSLMVALSGAFGQAPGAPLVSPP